MNEAIYEFVKRNFGVDFRARFREKQEVAKKHGGPVIREWTDADADALDAMPMESPQEMLCHWLRHEYLSVDKLQPGLEEKLGISLAGTNVDIAHRFVVAYREGRITEVEPELRECLKDWFGLEVDG